jgi:hypothetical protein
MSDNKFGSPSEFNDHIRDELNRKALEAIDARTKEIADSVFAEEEADAEVQEEEWYAKSSSRYDKKMKYGNKWRNETGNNKNSKLKGKDGHDEHDSNPSLSAKEANKLKKGG